MRSSDLCSGSAVCPEKLQITKLMKFGLSLLKDLFITTTTVSTLRGKASGLPWYVEAVSAGGDAATAATAVALALHVDALRATVGEAY